MRTRQPDSADRRCRRLGSEVTDTQSTAIYTGNFPINDICKQNTRAEFLPVSSLLIGGDREGSGGVQGENSKKWRNGAGCRGERCTRAVEVGFKNIGF